MEKVDMLSAELQRREDEREYLALDNLLLARRLADLEHQTVQRSCTNAGGFAALLGWSAKQEAEATSNAELHARAHENVQLQHALFEERRVHARSSSEHAREREASIAALRMALVDTEAQLEHERVAAAAAQMSLAHESGQLQSKLDALQVHIHQHDARNSLTPVSLSLLLSL